MNTDSHIPKSLREALKNREVVPFVGAGASMTIRKFPLEPILDENGNEKKDKNGDIEYKSLFPSWKGFVETLADALREDNKPDEADYVLSSIKIKKPKYLDALQHAQEQLGEAEWYRLFDESFDKQKADADEDSLKFNKLIWQLANNLIITTNVDRVFQWTCPQHSEFTYLDVQNVEYAKLLKEKTQKDPTVCHLHGHIKHKEKVIFTREQFESFYKLKDNEAKLKTLIDFIQYRTLLFIGFSLDDDYLLEQIEDIHRIYKGAADSLYILFREKDIPNANFPSYVTPIPFSEFGKPLEDKIEELIRIANEGDDSKPDNTETETRQTEISTESERLKNHFNVPFSSKGDAFVGREGLREKIWTSLETSGRAAISQAVSIKGIGGLGKTQLAVEYAHKYRNKYENGVYWLIADEDIDIQLIKVGESLRWISQFDTGFDQAELVRNRFRKLSDCLIVFDNVDDKKAIENYLPEKDSKAHILITSREKQEFFDEINLDVLSRDESRKLLLDIYERPIETEKEKEAFEKILDELGDLPLAVELVGGFLAENEVFSFSEYLNFLDEVPLNTLEEDFPSISFTRHDKSIIRTLKISEKLLSQKPYLEEILDVLAWSGKFSIGYSLLQFLVGIEDNYKLKKALSDLVNLRLIKEEKETNRFAIHRLVARVRKFEKPLEERKEWHYKIVENLIQWFRKRKDGYEFLTEFEAELIHLQQWQVQSSNIMPNETVHLTNFEAYPLWHRGKYAESKILLEKALELYQINNLDDEKLLAHIYNDLGVLASNQGNLDQSLKFREKALAIGRNVFDEKSEDIAKLLCNLGKSYDDFGNHQKALKLNQQAVEITKELFGEKARSTATSLASLSIIYIHLGNYQEGLKLNQQALEIYKELFGEKHPNYARALNNLGATYSRLNNHHKALKLSQRAFEIFKELFGEKHPAIAESLTNLGATQSNLSNHQKALESLQQAFEIAQEILGKQHPNTILCCYYLIYEMLKMGQTEKAGRLAGEFLSYIPQNHPNRRFFEEHGAGYRKAKQRKKKRR